MCGVAVGFVNELDVGVCQVMLEEGAEPSEMMVSSGTKESLSAPWTIAAVCDKHFDEECNLTREM